MLCTSGLLWTMGHLLQANGRQHGIGQTKPKNYLLINESTYDMLCQYRLWDKYLSRITNTA